MNNRYRGMDMMFLQSKSSMVPRWGQTYTPHFTGFIERCSAEESGLIFAVIIDRHINTKTDLESCISFIARIASTDKVQGGNQLEILIA
jgi:hypothetical protein